MVDDAEHALGARGLNGVVERGGQVLEDERHTVGDGREHMHRPAAAQGREHDQQHKAGN